MPTLPNSKAGSTPSSTPIKSIAWGIIGAAAVTARLGVALCGRTRRVDTIIYKVDRLGDWLLAEATIGRIEAAAKARGGAVVVWAGNESAALRSWHRPDYPIEAFDLESRGFFARLFRTFRVVRLLAIYEARTFVCLRYSPDPIRDFVLAHAPAADVHAMSSLDGKPTQPGIPREIQRHFGILKGIGLAPDDVRELLPKLPGRQDAPLPRAVLAPFSSATIKDWRDDAWCEVAADLVKRGLFIELWVGPGQTARAGELALKLKERTEVPEVAVRSGSVAELAEALCAAAIVLSVDTFTAHLAAALDAPMVCVLGGGHFGDFAPWQHSPRQRWVTHPLPCFNCSWRCTRSRVECLEDITHTDVLGEIEFALRWKEQGTG